MKASGIRQEEIENYDATLAELEETRSFYVEKLEALESRFEQIRAESPDFLNRSSKRRSRS